ncbi:MAG TPA: hypothetical protein VGM09_08575 [Bradyrhizobium sp.]
MDSVVFEGSAELIDAPFISVPNAELVTHAMTSPTQMHFAWFGVMPAQKLARSCTRQTNGNARPDRMFLLPIDVSVRTAFDPLPAIARAPWTDIS